MTVRNIKKKEEGRMTKKKRFTVQSSYLGMYTIFDEKQGKALTDREVIELLEKGDVND